MPHAARMIRGPRTTRPVAARLALALTAAVAQCSGSGVVAAEPETFARVEARAGTGVRTLDGRIVIEAVDGGLLLELPDQRYEVLEPAAVVSRGPLPGGPADEQPRDLGRRVLADLPPGFDLHVSRHYVICFNTSREYAKWVASLFERLHEAFTNAWRNAGLDVASPRHPLIVVIFAERADYEAFATRDVGPAADRIVGYYDLASNRVTTFDLTGSDLLARQVRRPPGRTGPEILASPEAAGLVATLVHEATHQVAFNCGLHRRQTGRETGAVRAIGGKVVHLVIQRLPLEREVAAVARQDRVSRAVAKPDRAGGSVRIRGGKTRVQNLQGIKAARHERADEIERKHQRPLRETRVEHARCEQQAQVRGHARVRHRGDVGPPAHRAAEPVDARVGRPEREVRGVAMTPIRVETADSEIAARDKHRPPRRAPARFGQRAGHPP